VPARSKRPRRRRRPEAGRRSCLIDGRQTRRQSTNTALRPGRLKDDVTSCPFVPLPPTIPAIPLAFSVAKKYQCADTTWPGSPAPLLSITPNKACAGISWFATCACTAGNTTFAVPAGRGHRRAITAVGRVCWSWPGAKAGAPLDNRSALPGRGVNSWTGYGVVIVTRALAGRERRNRGQRDRVSRA